MEDLRIIELYWQRDGRAIEETDKKYGAYCRMIAQNILADARDGEECVNDTWLAAWNSMPDKRPARLGAYLAAICRNAALNCARRYTQAKRGGGQLELALEELGECIPAEADVAREVERRELVRAIDAFLSRLSAQERRVFVARYWHMASTNEIARAAGASDAKIRSMLFRTRKKLAAYLREEGLV